MKSDTRPTHEYWMRLVLEEAERAMSAGELPIAAILTSNSVEISRAQTQVGRRGSIVAHGEMLALLEAGAQVFTAARPLILYANLEPCLMCLGAAMQCGIDEIVYGMQCAPDGGVRYVDDVRKGGQMPPRVTGQVLEDETVALFRRFLEENPSHFAVNYVRELLRPYDTTGTNK